MRSAVRMNLIIFRNSGFFFLTLIMLAFYLLLSFAIGYNAHAEYVRSGLEGFGLLKDNIGDLKTIVPISIMFITTLFYILPVIDVKNDRYKNAVTEMLPLSLPISRREFAVSRVVYTAGSSIVIVLLITAAVAAGIYIEGGAQWKDTWIIVRSWLVLTTAAINTAGVLLLLIYLRNRHFLFPASVALFAVYSFIRLISPETLYQIISSKLFWPLYAAVVLLTNMGSGTAAVHLFEKRDI